MSSNIEPPDPLAYNSGDYIDNFLDLQEDYRRRGVYTFWDSAQVHLDDIEELGYSCNVVRMPTETRPGRIAIETPGIGVAEVFSTIHATMSTYVSHMQNKTLTYEASLLLALKQPGRHFVLYGPSKVGKTQLWRAVLGPEIVPIPCAGIVKNSTLYAHALYRLKKPYLSSETIIDGEKECLGKSGSGSIGYKNLASLGGTRSKSNEKSIQRERLYALKDQPQSAIAVAGAFAEEKKFLVLENYHRLPSSVLEMVSHDLRTFTDNGVSVLFVGIPEDPFMIQDMDSELKGRVDYLEFALWPEDELKKIAIAGGNALNITFDDHSLEVLAQESCGSPLLMQEFCLVACLAERITAWQETDQIVKIKIPALGEGIKEYLAQRLAPYKKCIVILKDHQDKAGLATDFVSKLITSLKRKHTTMNIPFSELGVSELDTKKIRRFLKECDLHKRTQGIFAIAFNQNALTITDPGFLVFVRWILE